MEATVKRWKKELDPLDEWDELYSSQLDERLKYDVVDSGKSPSWDARYVQLIRWNWSFVGILIQHSFME